MARRGYYASAAIHLHQQGATATARTTLNKSLENANRMPCVSLPTFTAQLQAADQQSAEAGQALIAAEPAMPSLIDWVSTAGTQHSRCPCSRKVMDERRHAI